MSIHFNNNGFTPLNTQRKPQDIADKVVEEGLNKGIEQSPDMPDATGIGADPHIVDVLPWDQIDFKEQFEMNNVKLHKPEKIGHTAQEIENFIKNELSGKTFENNDAFVEFCGDYLKDLTVQQVYSNNENLYYKVTNGSDEVGTSVTVKKDASPKTESGVNASSATQGNNETGNSTPNAARTRGNGDGANAAETTSSDVGENGAQVSSTTTIGGYTFEPVTAKDDEGDDVTYYHYTDNNGNEGYVRDYRYETLKNGDYSDADVEQFLKTFGKSSVDGYIQRENITERYSDGSPKTTIEYNDDGTYEVIEYYNNDKHSVKSRTKYDEGGNVINQNTAVDEPDDDEDNNDNDTSAYAKIRNGENPAEPPVNKTDEGDNEDGDEDETVDTSGSEPAIISPENPNANPNPEIHDAAADPDPDPEQEAYAAMFEATPDYMNYDVVSKTDPTKPEYRYNENGFRVYGSSQTTVYKDPNDPNHIITVTVYTDKMGEGKEWKEYVTKETKETYIDSKGNKVTIVTTENVDKQTTKKEVTITDPSTNQPIIVTTERTDKGKPSGIETQYYENGYVIKETISNDDSYTEIKYTRNEEDVLAADIKRNENGKVIETKITYYYKTGDNGQKEQFVDKITQTENGITKFIDINYSTKDGEEVIGAKVTYTDENGNKVVQNFNDIGMLWEDGTTVIRSSRPDDAQKYNPEGGLIEKSYNKDDSTYVSEYYDGNNNHTGTSTIFGEEGDNEYTVHNEYFDGSGKVTTSYDNNIKNEDGVITSDTIENGHKTITTIVDEESGALIRQILYQYDDAEHPDRITGETVIGSDDEVKDKFKYEYDDDGNLVGKTKDDGSDKVNDKSNENGNNDVNPDDYTFTDEEINGMRDDNGDNVNDDPKVDGKNDEGNGNNSVNPDDYTFTEEEIDELHGEDNGEEVDPEDATNFGDWNGEELENPADETKGDTANNGVNPDDYTFTDEEINGMRDDNGDNVNDDPKVDGEDDEGNGEKINGDEAEKPDGVNGEKGLKFDKPDKKLVGETEHIVSKDKDGNVIGSRDIHYEYVNGQRVPVGETRYDSKGTPIGYTEYTPDANGNITAVRHYLTDSNGNTYEFTTKCTYDENGEPHISEELTKVTDKDGKDITAEAIKSLEEKWQKKNGDAEADGKDNTGTSGDKTGGTQGGSSQPTFNPNDYIHDGMWDWNAMYRDGWGTYVTGTAAQNAFNDLLNGASLNDIINNYSPTGGSSAVWGYGSNNGNGGYSGYTWDGRSHAGDPYYNYGMNDYGIFGSHGGSGGGGGGGYDGFDSWIPNHHDEAAIGMTQRQMRQQNQREENIM